MPILCEASVLHMAGGSLFRHGTFRCRSGKAGTFYATPGAASLPVCGYHTAQVLQPGLSPLHDLFLSALYSNPSGSCRCAEMRPYPPSPMKDAGPSPGPCPEKKRNFLDLWQTIAQDLSRLFAVPGGCPSCPGSRKDWPEPLSCFRRPVPAPSLLPAAFRKALCAVWPEHDAHADTDMTTRQGRTPFHRAAPPRHRGTGAGWLPEALRHSRMDLNKKFWQG